MTSSALSLTELWVRADQNMRDAKEQKDIIGAQLMGELNVGEESRLPSGAGARLVASRRQFSTDLAKQILPVDLLLSIAVTTTEPSGELAKQELPPDLYEQCRKTVGAPFLQRL